MRSVKTDSVYLIEESESSVLFGEITNFRDRTNATAHGVDALEGDDLRGLLRVLRELHLEVFQVVMLEYNPLGARVTHALDHGRVVHGVGEVNAPGELRAQGREGRVVGNVARREDECGGLAVKLGELFLKGKVHARVASDVSRTSGTVAVCVESAATIKVSYDASTEEK